MSYFAGKPWSDNPYAPQIPHSLYVAEKNFLTGALIGAIFYGIVIVLFFRCISALLHPVHCAREGVRWGLVAYTILVFSFVTTFTTMTLDLQSVSYIDNREFPGADALPHGPYGYEGAVYAKAINLVPNVMFLLINWLADGVLLYRCCVIYATNYWVTAFPCLMYLASLAMGIMFIYCEASQPIYPNNLAFSFNFLYFAISLSLNVLLTLMIAIRLVLRGRRIRNSTGALAATTGLCKAVITMLIESFALYAVNFLLFIVPWAASSTVSGIFFPILADVQVIAPFLITLRVANRRALSSEVIVSGNTNSLHFRTLAESTSSNEMHSEGNQMDGTERNG